MNGVARAERTARIKSLSAFAMRLIRQHGDGGWIEPRGRWARVIDFTHDELRLSYLRWDDGDLASILDIFYGRGKVMSVEWTPDRVTKTSFRPGEWERVLQRCERLPHISGR